MRVKPKISKTSNMKIISIEKQDITLKNKSNICVVHSIHVKVKNIKSRAKAMIKTISDTSWILKLSAIDQIAYEACSEKTIDKLVNEILKKVDNHITADFGEYMISDVAQCVLNKSYQHKKIPLAELWKEKLKNNMGFDFHTENLSISHLAYGEAKYSSSSSPYNKAISQIVKFIKDKKDKAELMHLKNFVTRKTTTNFSKDKKIFVAAFSVNAKDPKVILENALSATDIEKLLVYTELYLIGVEVDA